MFDMKCINGSEYLTAENALFGPNRAVASKVNKMIQSGKYELLSLSSQTGPESP
jgi:hypothetical protein